MPRKFQDQYRIEECKRGFFVIHVGAGKRFGPYLSQTVAQGVIEALCHEAKPVDAETQAIRKTRAAYRLIARDPYLQLLRKILPKNGKLERTTQDSYRQSLKFVGTLMSIGASDPLVHAELNKSSGQRRISKAARVHGGQGNATRAQVAKRLKALGGTPAHKRASQIAQDMNLDPAYVRRLVRQLLK